MVNRNSFVFGVVLQGLCTVLALYAIAACESINPVGKAETLEQRAYAVYGTYVLFAEKAADLAENDALSRSVRLGLVDAEERTSPVIASLLNAVQEMQTLNNSTTRASLEGWVDRALPLINDLVRSVKGAQE
jgi:hypothetical protein